MIIKIDSYNKEDEYRLISGIQNYVLKRKLLKPKDVVIDADLIVFDIDTSYTDKDVYSFHLICEMENGSEYSIFFDTMAYIMNNEGKIIDIIVANYYDF